MKSYFINKVPFGVKININQQLNMSFDQSNSQIFGCAKSNMTKLQQEYKKQQCQDDQFDNFDIVSVESLQATKKKRKFIVNDCSDQIQTPRKQVRITNQFDNKKQDNRRLKTKYKVQEKTTPSKFVTIPLFVFTFIAVGILIGSIYNKYDSLHQQTVVIKQQCSEDYAKNRCQRPVTDLKNYCRQKQTCMNSTLDQLFKEKLKLSSIFGQIVKQMVEGAGLWVNSFVFVLIILGLVFGKNKIVTKQFIEYE